MVTIVSHHDVIWLTRVCRRIYTFSSFSSRLVWLLFSSIHSFFRFCFCFSLSFSCPSPLSWCPCGFCVVFSFFFLVSIAYYCDDETCVPFLWIVFNHPSHYSAGQLQRARYVADPGWRQARSHPPSPVHVIHFYLRVASGPRCSSNFG